MSAGVCVDCSKPTADYRSPRCLACFWSYAARERLFMRNAAGTRGAVCRCGVPKAHTSRQCWGCYTRSRVGKPRPNHCLTCDGAGHNARTCAQARRAS